jgi:hypothetical protein
MSEEHFLLDADSFIRSKQQHYAFDFCPGYWDALLRGFNKKRVGSIVPVRNELLKGNDALAKWVKDTVPGAFYASIDDIDVQKASAEVLQWVEDNERYYRGAKDKFVAGADPWLIAFARATKRTLVTYEVSAPESKVLVKLPDVARQFKVKCIPPYVMLRRLEVVLSLAD